MALVRRQTERLLAEDMKAMELVPVSRSDTQWANLASQRVTKP